MTHEEQHQQHQRQELQLLVCSANLGNACIDEESLCQWIPADGRCREVVTPEPRYPLQFPLIPSTSDHPADAAMNYRTPAVEKEYSETDRFDIIVFGLQESTFDPPEPTAALLDVDPSNGSNNNSNHYNKFSPTAKLLVGDPLIGAGGYLVKNTKKTISQLNTITTSRDYSKQKQQQQQQQRDINNNNNSINDSPDANRSSATPASSPAGKLIRNALHSARHQPPFFGRSSNHSNRVSDLDEDSLKSPPEKDSWYDERRKY